MAIKVPQKAPENLLSRYQDSEQGRIISYICDVLTPPLTIFTLLLTLVFLIPLATQTFSISKLD